jgi:hypothetical protein
VITIRRSEDRGASRLDWLDSRHTFSFADYYDPSHTGFRTLRVINDDRIAPGAGFGAHAHRDMEILTWVLDGALQHRDSLGNGSVIRPGEAQRMTAGTGIRHSEYNPSRSEPARLLQIWILPERAGLPPGYEQRGYEPADLRGRLLLIASRAGRDGSVTLHQDADVYAARLEHRESARHALVPGRHAWLQVARGAVTLDGHRLAEGDGAAITAEARLEISAESPAEVLLFDLA